MVYSYPQLTAVVSYTNFVPILLHMNMLVLGDANNMLTRKLLSAFWRIVLRSSGSGSPRRGFLGSLGTSWHGVTPKKTWIWSNTTVRTLNLRGFYMILLLNFQYQLRCT